MIINGQRPELETLKSLSDLKTRYDLAKELISEYDEALSNLKMKHIILKKRFYWMSLFGEELPHTMFEFNMSTIEHFSELRQEVKYHHRAFGSVAEDERIGSNKIDDAKSALKGLMFGRKADSDVRTWGDFRKKYDLDDYR